MPINKTISFQNFLKQVNKNDLSDNNKNTYVLICAHNIGKQFWLNALLNEKISDNERPQSFDSFPIVTLNAWQQTLWQKVTKLELVDAPVALNTLQQNYLLTQLLNQFVERRNTDKYGQFFNPLHLSQSNINAIARSVINSWRFIQHHDLSIAPKDIVSADHFLFYHVVKNYDLLLQENNWLDPDRLSDALSGSLINESSPDILMPNIIYLSGFSQWTKQQLRFISALEQCGIDIILIEDDYQNKNIDASFELEKFDSSTDEINSVIDRFIDSVDLNATNQKPLAIFVANLASKENIIREALTDKLGNNIHRINAFDSIDWHIDSKSSLIDMPALHILQSLFNCWQPSFDYVDFSKILLSPYFWQSGDLSDMEFRHVLDKKLRQELPKKVTLSQILSSLKNIQNRLLEDPSLNSFPTNESNIANLIIKSCADFLANTQKTNLKFASFHQSGAWLSEQLSLFQWIGYSDFNKIINTTKNTSVDNPDTHYAFFYRSIINASGALHYLHDCLDTISSLNLVFENNGINNKATKSISLFEFRRIFFQQLQAMSLATDAQSAQARIQVYDMQTSASLYFDNCCLINLNDKDWPPGKQYYPFIPFNILMDTDCAHIDSQRIYDHSLSITRRLLSTSTNCLITYSQFIDALEVSFSNILSPFIKPNIKSSNMAGYNASLSSTNTIYENLEIWQSYSSNDVRPLISNPSEVVTITGGADAIKNQIACPFRAWAKNRASILPLEENDLALNPKLHGISIHKILELFWLKYKDHSTLASLYANESIDAAIKSVVDNYFSQRYKDSFYDNFSRVYPPALLALIKEWLNFELTRPNFSIVEQEKKQRFVINNAAFNIKPDRIDRLLDEDKFLIIDYKSGSTDITKWYDHFISEPQLPIYFLMYHQKNSAVDSPAYGIAYANLKTNDVSMTGILPDSNYSGFLTDVSSSKFKAFEDMGELINFWQETISTACDDFVTGQHKVHPTKDACKYCQYASLCRINNLNVITNEDDESGELH